MQRPLLLALPPIVTLIGAGTLWLASSNGYYALIEMFDLAGGYDEAPMLFTAYYLGFSALALAAFHTVLKDRARLKNIGKHLIALAPLLAVYGAYVTLVLPSMPEISVSRAPANPPEFMFATAWYYLPKSAEILFQQILVAAMVLAASYARVGLVSLSLGIAALFGGFHLLLILDGFTSFYVARFTIAATLFGLIIPYLYLRTRFGFRWAYGLHWGFYALDAGITHFVLAVQPA